MKKQANPNNDNHPRKAHSPSTKPRPIGQGKECGSFCHIFTGGPDESASSFLKTFNKDASRYGWTDDQRIGVFEDALVCEPRRWFRSINRCVGFKNWKSVEKEFLTEWGLDSSTSYNNRWPYQVSDSDSSNASSAEIESSDGLLTSNCNSSPSVREQMGAHQRKATKHDDKLSYRDVSKNNYGGTPTLLDSEDGCSISDPNSDSSGSYARYISSDYVFSSTLWAADQKEDLIFRDRDGNPQRRPASTSPKISNINDFLSTLD